MKIRVRVKPHSSRDEISQEGDEYTVRIRQAPVEGKANEAVLKLIATEFKVPKSAVRIVSGLTGRVKIIEIRT